MRAIYTKRSLLFTLLATSSLISLLYFIDFHFFQQRQLPPESFLQGNRSLPLGGSKVVLKSKPADQLPPTRSTAASELKCSVSLVLILCEDVREAEEVGGSPVASDFSRQINQTLVLLKSVALQTHLGVGVPRGMRDCVRVFILGEKEGHFEEVRVAVKEGGWAEEFRRRLQLVFLPVSYPRGSEWMRRMFRPCATLRLFIPDIFALRRRSGEGAEDSSLLVYVDTDFVFLRSVQSLVLNYFGGKEARGSKVVAGMAPCLFHYGTSSNKIPYFGNSGLNAGLMVMNVTRMSETQWTRKIRMVTAMFQESISLADQDILNIYFHFFPEELTLFSCDWNFRPFQCREGSHCEDSALAGGISALHGNALSFTSAGREPLFEAVFQVFHNHLRLDGNFSLDSFVEVLETAVLEVEEGGGVESDCVKYGGFRTLVLNRFDAMLRSLETPAVDFEILTEEAVEGVYER